MINRIIIIGRLTKDPELRHTQNGMATASFTLAVDRPFTNRDGDRDTDFIRVVTWRRLAENCANYLERGRLAGVDGRLQIRSFDNKEGQRVTIAEVVADNVRFLESRKSRTSNEPKKPNAEDIYGDPFDEDAVDISSDDLPF